jgi:hypothetical protein
MKRIPVANSVIATSETLVDNLACSAPPGTSRKHRDSEPGRHALCSVTHSALVGVLLVSVASTQNQTWIRQLGTPHHDSPWGAAADGSGGVYIGGSSAGNLGGQGADPWLARYDSTGNPTWVRQFGSGYDDYLIAAAPDGSGGVFVGGSIWTSANAEIWLARYDSAGNQTWIRQFGTIGSDEALAAAPDGSGGVYMSGYAQGSLGGPSGGGGGDVWLARYDSAGTQMWIRQFGTNGFDQAHAAAPDGAGGVYVSGQTTGSLGGANMGFSDVWLAHYDSVGSQTWVRQFGTSSNDFAFGGAPDGMGGVFICGTTLRSLGGPSAGVHDAWLARYDSTGNQTWIRQLGTSATDEARAATPDTVGGVYVSGFTYGSLGGPNAGGADAWLAHYDSIGNQTWILQIGTAQDDNAYKSAPDASGGVYMCGDTWGGALGGPSAGGADAWLARYDGGPTASRYCSPAIPNSAGQAGILNATGSSVVVANNLALVASQLPQNSYGYFLTSRTRGYVIGAGGSQGALCLGGAIGRYVGPGQIMNSGTTGSFSLAINLTMMPQPFGRVAAQPGDSWNFQAWHRDAVGGAVTSNFTDALRVHFH